MTLKLGFVGNGADKFTSLGEERAKTALRVFMSRQRPDVVVSGHSPLGGIDIWTEEIAAELHIPTDIKYPKTHTWEGGYKNRNIEIARASDVVIVVVADKYPPFYVGRRFESCYHCHRNDHVKSGGCWTALRALRLGRQAEWYVIPNGAESEVSNAG